jgi:hypothetical protein
MPYFLQSMVVCAMTFFKRNYEPRADFLTGGETSTAGIRRLDDIVVKVGLKNLVQRIRILRFELNFRLFTSSREHSRV